MVSLETSIALSALVIGLVAFFIALGQLTQQLLSTAEGHRRCQQSVIGPWARRTRRVWHWREFRYETKFTTPEILIYEWTVLIDWLTVSGNGKDSNTELVQKVEETAMSVGAMPRTMIDINGPDLPIELRKTVRQTLKEDALEEVEVDSGDEVSWTSFLRQLHKLQGSWQQSTQVSLQPAKDGKHMMVRGARICVAYRERTWDLMPPDTIRPMASTRLGTMIVLALRLGMTWRNVNLNEGVLRAEGNGHALLSTMLRGLGVVFQYSFNPHHFQPYMDPNWQPPAFEHGTNSSNATPLVQGQLADKMSCGILPGTDTLDIPDMPFSGDNIDECATLLGSALSTFGVPQRTISVITEHRNYQDMLLNSFIAPAAFPIHDMVAVTAPFLPSRGSSNTLMPYPIRTNVALGAFLFWETRETFLEQLRERPGKTSLLQEVYTRLEEIAMKYKRDFWCEWTEALVTSSLAAESGAKIEFLADLRKTHDWTTRYFESIKARLPFKYLVAAHVAMSADEAFKFRNNGERDWRRMALMYVGSLPSLCEKLRPKLKLGEENIAMREPDLNLFLEEAWWVLVLRGIAWRMSIHHFIRDTIVPSRLYYDQTPVYIM